MPHPARVYHINLSKSPEGALKLLLNKFAARVGAGDDRAAVGATELYKGWTADNDRSEVCEVEPVFERAGEISGAVIFSL